MAAKYEERQVTIFGETPETEFVSTICEMFNYEEHDVRVRGTSEDPWFCAKDICEILEYKDPKVAIWKNVDEDNKKPLSEVIKLVDLKSTNFLDEELTYHQGKIVYINEAGLYELILSSKFERAKPFKKFVCNTIIPNFRRQDKRMAIEALERQMQQLRLENENERSSRQDAEQRREVAEKRADREQRYNLKLSSMVAVMKSKERNQFVYIATSEQYALRNRFKVGGVKNRTLLKGRLSTYNSGRPPGDKMYFCNLYDCSDYKHLEQRIERVIGSHREEKTAEVYNIHYDSLKMFLEYISEHYKEENTRHEQMFHEIIRDTIDKEPVVPKPLILNGAEYRTFIDGVEEVTQAVDWDAMDEAEKVEFVSTVFEEYLKSVGVSGGSAITVERKKFETYLVSSYGAKFKKMQMWSTVKEVSKSRDHIRLKY